MNKILQFTRLIVVLWRFRRFSNSKQTSNL